MAIQEQIMDSATKIDQVSASAELYPPVEALNRANRLLPHVLEEEASKDPQRVIAIMAKSSDISMGFEELTIGQFLHAVNFTAHWIDSDKIDSPPAETYAFVGPQDFRYPIIELAAMKTGNPLLLPRAGNALANTVSLLNATKSTKFFYASEYSDLAARIVAVLPHVKTYEVPSLREMTVENTEPYPYNKSWDTNKDEIAVIIHTSGSTGAPKPKNCTHAFLSSLMNSSNLLPGVPGRITASLDLIAKGKLLLTACSFSHGSGLISAFTTIIQGSTIVFGPPNVPSSGKILHDIMKVLPIHGLVNVPSITEQLFLDHGEDLKDEIAALKHVSWLGGPLSQKTGDFIVSHTNAILWQGFGSTESGLLPLLVPPKSHWQYIEFHPKFLPELEPISPGSLLCELVLNKYQDPALSWSQPVFHMAPDQTTWRTRDILRRYDGPLPDGVGPLWKFENRIDDLIILSNAAKVNPVHIETLLQSHPLLNGCIVFGESQTRCGILLEPKEGSNLSEEELVALVWPDVEEANGTVPGHARIERDLVLVVKNDKRFERAAKGTFIRSLCLKMYKSEIDDLYAKFKARKAQFG
ncbi:hypothetical protein sscle_01g001920 [Sclerotinia sclerotiorum 1980 UF-70]|nr:hypothetical protein sscle_01g001920 [Sclerotinia sclerotiorum 1980 UF-70]